MQVIRLRAIQFLLALTPLFYSCAMATEQVLLWPAIEGQILNAGKPVHGLELTQTLYWNYEESKAPPRVLTVKTDAEGRFVFPKITGEISTGFMTRLFHQPGIGLTIDTKFEGRDVGVFASMGSSYTNSPRQNLICDLGNLRPLDGGLVADCKVTRGDK
ncbi:MAG: hypothetical protein RLO04_14215 [Limnobacter sp.]|uniref:DUF6795 domain-containing protein n=1 Tax=Limnobacter sp. TaxID=2003368 RepID=UPI002732B84A|nr:DUF6795 domain-containing protein [Limnobacter sp.]MDP3189603.1 hypothetical protein [Limnobacter sp.]